MGKYSRDYPTAPNFGVQVASWGFKKIVLIDIYHENMFDAKFLPNMILSVIKNIFWILTSSPCNRV